MAVININKNYRVNELIVIFLYAEITDTNVNKGVEDEQKNSPT